MRSVLKNLHDIGKVKIGKVTKGSIYGISQEKFNLFYNKVFSAPNNTVTNVKTWTYTPEDWDKQDATYWPTFTIKTNT